MTAMTSSITNTINKITFLAALLASLLVFSACTGGAPANDGLGSGIVIDHAASDGSGAADQAGTGSLTDSALLGDIPTVPYVDSSTRAVVVSAGLDVLDAPDGQIITTLDSTTTFGTARVLLVEEQEGDWVKVRLPVRPNHRTGWIPASAVNLETVDLAVYVDLQAKTLSVQSGQEIVVRSPVAIGTAENPTPIGTFYVTDKLETPDPAGSYGPFAIGLSGHSETLTEFAGGDGQIGIHGTNDPGTIGEAVSHGCVRLPNDVIEELASLLPLGTPVHIV